MNRVYRFIVWASLLAGMILYLVTNSAYVLGIVCFIQAIIYVIVEFYKLSFGRRKIDTSKGFPRFLFGENSTLEQSGMFFEESILNAKGSKILVTWFLFLLCIAYIVFFIVTRFTKIN